MSESERAFPRLIETLHPVEKMVFLAGPRQVGKTTIAQSLLSSLPDGGMYLNYDIPAHRRLIISGNDLLSDLRKPKKRPMVVFDEIHKMAKFKAFLKGFYDENKNDSRIWVTGSGRLDLFQKGGDSLLGRYFLYHLHPFSIGELTKQKLIEPETCWKNFEDSNTKNFDYKSLLDFGGFPEPLFKGEKSFHKRWITSRKDRITREDIRDLTRIQDLDRLEKLIDLLQFKIGSPLSVNSLREDLSVAFETIEAWLETLARVYYIYFLKPFSNKINRAIRKERKMYFWDLSTISDPGAKFENFVVSHFQKACNAWNDFGISEAELCYSRDKEKREVDIVLLIDKKPFLLAEVKLSDTDPSPHLLRFSEATGCKRLVQIVNIPKTKKTFKKDGKLIYIVSPENLFPFF